jgi:hypothetical protein
MYCIQPPTPSTGCGYIHQGQPQGKVETSTLPEIRGPD